MSHSDKHDAPKHAVPIPLVKTHEPDPEIHHSPAGHKPALTPAPAPQDPLLAKMQKLITDIAATAKKHRADVLSLRGMLDELMAESPANMPGQPFVTFHSLATRAEEEINKLDCDCSAKA